MASKRNPSQSDSDEFEYQYGCTVSFQLCQHFLTIKIIFPKGMEKVKTHAVGMAAVRLYGLGALLWEILLFDQLFYFSFLSLNSC